jgi:hypothetical protein
LSARQQIRESGTIEPHAVLAALPFPLYVTTSLDDQMERALLAAGKAPKVGICRWHERLMPSEPHEDVHGQPTPTPDRPLVFHLFGRIDLPDSAVLTEDDYFRFLTAVAQEPQLVPAMVRAALARSALLFLGFTREEWGFRVLFHSLGPLTSRGSLSRYQHVAVLPAPDEGWPAMDSARDFVRRYFDDNEVLAYWGSVEDFVQELGERWRPASGAL